MLSDGRGTQELAEAASAVGSEGEFKFDGVDVIYKHKGDYYCEGCVFVPHCEWVIYNIWGFELFNC